MLKELLKRLQKRELTEQQEQELLNQMQAAASLIEENTKQRAIEKAKLDEINKDQVKVKNLDEINSKIAEKRNQIKKLDNRHYVFISLYVLLFGAGLIGLFASMTVGTLANLSLPQLMLIGVAGTSVWFAGMFPLGKFMGKKRRILLNELQKLNEEKKQMLDEINVDIEKLAMDNLKLTNLPKLTKNTERTNEQVITEETINTI